MPGALEPGSTISHYRVIASLGAGGMGEVYKAHDTNLDRTVALKILPPELVRNDDRVRRFVQEAKSASSLNHPHIITIHEIGHVDSIHYIAMELVDGQTLKTKIHDGDTDLRTLLMYLTQAAEGLAKAHSAGIVHRDLKPENIMISRDGYAKVLDFGLAKLSSRKSAEGVTGAPTLARDQTREGAILGKVAYMSPEQVQGRVVDHRSDIFSFGCILYEAATRQKPFEADSDIDVMHKIVHDKPKAIDEINPAVPAEVRRVIRRCLAKDPDKRYQSMKDVAIELAEIVEDFDALSAATSSATSGSGSISSPPMFPPARRRFIWIAGIALAAVIIAAIALVEWRRAHSAAGAAGPLQSMRIERLTSAGNVIHACISPDGRYVAYVIRDENLNYTLFLKQVATSSDVKLLGPSPTRIVYPRFSPDGEYVYYDFYDSAGPGQAVLYRVPALGGAPKKLVVDIDSPVSVSPDGTQISFGRGILQKSENDILVARADGTGERVIARHERIARTNVTPIESIWSSDGKIVITARSTAKGGIHDELVEIDVGSGTERPFSRHWYKIYGVAWMPDRTSLIVAAVDRENTRSQLWLQPYPTGDVRRITNDLNDYGDVTVTNDGKTLATTQINLRSRLYVATMSDESGGRPLIGELRDIHVYRVAASSNGRIVYDASSGSGADIWLVDSDGSVKQLTNDHASGIPAISDDGRVIVFVSTRNGGVQHLWCMDADGSNVRQITSGTGEIRPALSGDGALIAFTAIGKALYTVPLGGGTPVKVADAQNRAWIAVSRDGKFIVYDYWGSTGATSHRLTVIPIGGGKPVLDVPFSGGTSSSLNLSWTPEGDAVSYDRIAGGAHNIWKQPLDGSAPKQLTNFKRGVITSFAWLPGGKLVIGRREDVADVVLISDFR